jgi:hypothetical protein
MTSLFADDPAEYFDYNSDTAHHLPKGEQEALQLAALQRRFSEMRDRLPPLKALADAAGIEEITLLEDAAALLFPHSFYKSYPDHFLECGSFNGLTEWLQCFTLNDLSPVATEDYDTIDEWLTALDTHTELNVLHSSGTTGRLSLMPRGKRELAAQERHARMTVAETLEPLDREYSDKSFALIWPSFAGGWSAFSRAPKVFAQAYCQTPGDIFPLFEGDLSADWQYYQLRMDRARLARQMPPRTSHYVLGKIDEMNAIFKAMPDHHAALLDRIKAELSGRQAMLLGAPMSLYTFASDGLARGMEPGLAPGSIVLSFGGMKGQPQAADMDRNIRRFSGAERILSFYGMTELSAGFGICRHDRYHIPPWMIPYMFDTRSGRPLARNGVQKGRIGFIDLVAQTQWGGVISADEVELSWDNCACRRTTPHVHQSITRIDSDTDENYEIGAASPNAIHAALSALSLG